MVGSKGFQSQWEQSKVNAKIVNEIVSEQVIYWPKSKIREVFPHGYDLSKVNKLTGDPSVELRAITGII